MEQSLRQTAYKVWIADIVNKKLEKEEGEWSPNYVLVDNKKISRVNIIATIIMKYVSEDGNYATLTVDDGSSDIQIKVWKEDIPLFENVEIGDPVLVVGKIKEYNSQIYLTPEIVKLLDKSEWVELRKRELKKLYGERVVQKQTIKETSSESINEQEPETIIVKEESISDNLSKNDRQKILDSIEKLDTGTGADTINVIEKSQIIEDQANSIIQELLKEGEIFEIRAGKLKIIE